MERPFPCLKGVVYVWDELTNKVTGGQFSLFSGPWAITSVSDVDPWSQRFNVRHS